ncbi:MAG: efflux RND transporter permease subunit [Pseudomonadota bacterium]
MDLAGFAIRNSKTTWFAVLLLTIGGIVSFFSLGQLEDPEFTIKTAVIATPYPGASPLEVEQEVTERIERKLQEIKEIDQITSESRAGMSTIVVDIKAQYWSDELPQIWDTLRRKIRDIETQLPPGAGRPAINDDFGDVLGLVIALTSDGFSQAELRSYAEDLERELALVEGVGRVDLWGVRDRAIYVDASEEALAALGISGATLLSTLDAQNTVVDAGRLNVGDYRMRIAPTGAFQSPEDIADLAIRPSAIDALSTSGAISDEIMRLGDLGEVREGYADPPTTLMRFDGKPAVGIALSFQSGVNVVAIGQAVDARLAELLPMLPVGIEVEKVHWQSDDVDLAVSSFLISLAQAVIIVLGVLTLAMGVRMGLIIGSGLLLTILATFIPLAIFGIDLQRMSLGALIIALGMMVDNSIVVAEGASVRMQKGMDKVTAAIEAASRPAIPLLGATIVATMAFYPIFASVESAGEYCRTLFSVVAVSLLISWLLSVTVTPLQCVSMLKVAAESDKAESRLLKGYRALLETAVRVRYLTIGIAVAALVASVIAFGSVTQLFFPTSAMTKFMIDFYAPEGTRIETVAEAAAQIETRVSEEQGVIGTSAFIGAGPPRFYLPVDPEGTNPAYAQVIVNVEDHNEIPAIAATMTNWLEENYPEATAFTRRFGVGPATTWGFEARIVGPADADPEILRSYGDEALQILEAHPWTKVSRTDWFNKVLTQVPEFDQASARWTGTTYEDLGNATKRAFDGRTIGIYREDDELLPIILRPPEADLTAVDNFELLQVQNPRVPGTIPLAQVLSDLRVETEDPVIQRLNRARTLTVQANPIDGITLPSYRDDLLAEFDALAATLPEGYRMEWGGEYEDTVAAQASLLPGLAPALAVIALIVVGLFNAYRPPLVIFAVIPFVVIGIAPSLLATGTPFGFVALLGAMSLAGMMIKNAIVLIDQINENLTEGMPPYEALIDAGVSRLRPVMLAAATTVLGVIPLLPDVFWIGLAVTIMGGLTVGTILTMILVPVLYATFHGIRRDKEDSIAPIGNPQAT